MNVLDQTQMLLIYAEKCNLLDHLQYNTVNVDLVIGIECPNPFGIKNFETLFIINPFLESVELLISWWISFT